MTDGLMCFSQGAAWDTPNQQSQYSPATTFSLDKASFDRFDSWDGVPLNTGVKPEQAKVAEWSGTNFDAWDGVPLNIGTKPQQANVYSGTNWDTPPSSVSRGQSRGPATIDVITEPENDINWDLEQAPTLDDQLELLGLDDSEGDESFGAKFGDKEIHDAVLFGAPMLLDEEYAERTKNLIPQYGLLGSILQTKLQDTRIFLNSNNPASFFICGLQGSGKSHTLSTLLGEVHLSRSCILKAIFERLD